jgi:glyoxylase-like metal-dependent hydrolase (beta-lactamase superfamily II)
MAPGDVHEVTVGDVDDLHVLDTGMYDTAEYGAVYLLDAEQPALVDTGIGTNHERVLAAMDEVGIAREDLAVIAPTHVHLDHAGGAGFIAQRCPNAEVVCHELGARHLVDPGRLWEGTKRAVGEQIQYYVEPEPVPEDRVREVTDGDVVDLGDHELVVHHAPGHAPHHCVFEDPANDAVFTADAAGIYVPALAVVEPTTPPPNFDFEQCLADLDALEALDPEVLLFAHYGPHEGTAPLAEYRETLTAWVDRIESARADFGDDDAVVATLVDQALDRDDLRATWGERKLRAETAMNARGVLHHLGQRDG